MLEAIELRLGNLVVFEDSWFKDEWAIITCIQHHCVLIKNYHGTPLMKDIEPIPLTEEWLKKFMFQKDNYGVFEKTKDNTNTSESEFELWMKKCLVNNDWVWNVCVGQDFANLTELCNIKYVHQLQNLYFSLTGKELVIS